jgi:hypothetical protein
MKSIIPVGLFLLTIACQPADSKPASSLAPGTATRTPPAPASITPELTLTPTLAPTPLPRFFTEEFEGELPNWSLLISNNDSAPQTRVQDGVLIFDLPSPFSWTYAVIGVETYTDVRIDARVQSRAGSPDAIGVVCRYSNQDGWYEFNISGDKTYNVLHGRWLAVGVARYTPIAFDSSEYLNPGGADNEIGLTCQGTTLWLYINSKLFRKLNETRFALTEGQVGLSISSFENTPVSAGFDWVRVSEPTE